MRDTWFRILGEYPSGVACAVVEWYHHEGREFAPTPGQIAERVRLIMSPDDRVPDIDQALTEILTSINRYGRGTIPEFSHPAIAAAVSAIGWQSICNSTNADILRSQLMRVYSTAAERHRRAQAISPSVRGVIENVAATLGLERGT